MFTEEQIKHGFWHWNRGNDFPPSSITRPEEYIGQTRVNIACTQDMKMTASEQKTLVKEWVEFLPNCHGIEMLWFTTHTQRQLFESVCELKNLVGLNIKWSNIKELDKISNLKSLKYLRIGSSAQIRSITPLTTLNQLEVLDIENFKKITDFSPLTALNDLRFLSIEGGMYTKQKVDSFEPISELGNLIYFRAAMISCPDRRIDPILNLKNLKTLNWCFRLTANDLTRLRNELPDLKYFPGRYQRS